MVERMDKKNIKYIPERSEEKNFRNTKFDCDHFSKEKEEEKEILNYSIFYWHLK